MTAAPAVSRADDSTPLVPTTFTGRVAVPAEGGITVTLYEQPWIPGMIGDPPSVAVATTLTADDGSFSIGPHRAGNGYYTFGFKHASADWRESFWRNVTDLGGLSLLEASYIRRDLTPQINMVMRGSGTFIGTVRGGGGLPVSGATVHLLGGAGWITDVTAANGTYSLVGVPPGAYTILVEEYVSARYLSTWAPDRATQTAATTFTIGAQQTVIADVDMRAATSFSGTLLRTDGAPAQGVLIDLWTWNEQHARWLRASQWGTQAVTDEEGRWTYPGQTAGRYKLGFYPSGKPNLIATYHPGKATLEEAVEIVATEGEAVTIDSTIEAGGELHVACWYKGALQPPTATVLYRRAGVTGPWEVFRAESGWLAPEVLNAVPAGTYRVLVTPTGEQWGDDMRSTFYADSETIEGASDVVVLPDAVVSIVTTSHAVEAVSGYVRRSVSGEPIGDAQVLLWKLSGGAWSVCATQTSFSWSAEAGSYAFEDLSVGTYRVTFTHAGYRDLGYPDGSGVGDARDLVIARGDRLRVDGTMQPVPGSIVGTVRDSLTSEPIPNARIEYYAQPRTGDTAAWWAAGPVMTGALTADAAGRYRLEYEDHIIAFNVSDPTGAHATQPIDRFFGLTAVAPGEEVARDFALAPRARVSGIVVDEVTSLPLAGISVVVNDLASMITGAAGTFDMGLVDPGWYSVTAADPSSRYRPFVEYGRLLEPGVDQTMTVRMTRDVSIPDSDTIAPLTVSDAKTTYPGIGTVVLSATDNEGGSGVAHTYYVLDGGSQVDDTWLTVEAVGPHVLEYWSTDGSGNVEGRTRKTFNVTAVPGRTLRFSEAFQYPQQRWGFDYPKSATVDVDGNVWVAMWDRLRRFSPDGTYLSYDMAHAGDVRRAAGEGVYAISRANGRVIDRLAADGHVLASIEVTASNSGTVVIEGMAVGRDGDLYVADSSGGRVLRYGPDGTLVRVFGFGGASDMLGGATGGLASPVGAAVDDSGTVYVAEELTKDIQSFSGDGRTALIFACENAAGVAKSPMSIDLGSNDELLVNVGMEVWRFSRSGTWLGVFSTNTTVSTNTRFQVLPDGTGLLTDINGRVVRFLGADGVVQRSVGSVVDHTAMLWLPGGIAFGASGRGYVTDGHAHVHMITDLGADLGTFPLPVTPVANAWPKVGHVAVDRSGDVYVPDPDHYVTQINRFTADGAFVSTVMQGQEAGPGIGFSPDGDLFVANRGGRSLLHFTPDLEFLGSWRSMAKTVVNYFFDQPVATSPNGEVLVGQQATDRQSRNRVLRYTSDGANLGEMSPRGSASSGGQEVSGIAVAPDGTVFVSDRKGKRIEYFSAAGVYQGVFLGTDDMPFASPAGLAFDRFGRLWVTDGDGLRCFGIVGLGAGTTVLVPPMGIVTAKWGQTGPAARISWATPTSAPDGFVVQRAKNAAPDSAFTTVANLSGSAISWTDTSVDWGSTWFYRVRSYRGAAASPWAVAAAFRVDSVVPVTGADTASSYVGQATLHLSPKDEVDGSGVVSTYYVVDGGSRAQGTTVAVNGTGPHTVAFWSVDAAGNTEATKTASFVVTAAGTVRPKAIVYEPHAPSTMYRNHHYTIYGYVKPRHSSGTYLVQLNLYLKNSRGVYVYHSHVHARRYDHSSTMTKYKASVSLPHRGKWRVRAYHSDSGHAASYSGYDYVTVK